MHFSQFDPDSLTSSPQLDEVGTAVKAVTSELILTPYTVVTLLGFASYSLPADPSEAPKGPHFPIPTKHPKSESLGGGGGRQRFHLQPWHRASGLNPGICRAARSRKPPSTHTVLSCVPKRAACLPETLPSLISFLPVQAGGQLQSRPPAFSPLPRRWRMATSARVYCINPRHLSPPTSPNQAPLYSLQRGEYPSFLAFIIIRVPPNHMCVHPDTAPIRVIPPRLNYFLFTELPPPYSQENLQS